MRNILAVVCVLVPGLALAQVAGVTPVKTLPGYQVEVKATTPLPVTCTNCSTSGGTSGGGVTPVVGVDGGYPLKINQGDPGAAAWPVDGSGVTQPVSGTFFQATQPVSIAATVNTSDAHTSAINSLACQLTDGAAFYKGPTTTQLPAALDGSGFLKTHEQGTAAVSAASLPLPSGASTDATLTGGTAKTQVYDGTNVIGTAAHPVRTDPTGSTTQPVSLTSTTITGNVTAVQGTGSNLHVVVDTAPTTTVTGTVAATQSGTWTVQPGNTANTTAWKVDASATTQPVSGTVTANAGSNLNTSALALDATLTGGTQTTRVTDGTNTATVKAASTPAAATDKSLVVALNPNSPLGAGSAVIGHVINDASSAVIGHVITDTNSTTAVTGNVTAVQPTGTNLHAVLDTTSTTAVTQATGTNLHAVLDTTSTTAVTQATGTNLHAVLDTTSTTAVTQATGTNLHAVLDTTSTTACTQATGTNLHVVTDATSVLAANQSVNAAQIAGTNTVNGGLAGTLGVGGTAATNAAITQNPILVGFEAQSGAPAAATTGNQRQGISNLDGAEYVVAGGPNRVNGGFNSVAASLTGVIAAPGAGLFFYMDALYIGSTTATAGTYAVTCGTGAACVTTNVAYFPVSGTANRFTYPPNTAGMAVIPFNPPLRCPTATQLVCIICVATNTCSGQIEGHYGH